MPSPTELLIPLGWDGWVPTALGGLELTDFHLLLLLSSEIKGLQNHTQVVSLFKWTWTINVARFTRSLWH